MTLAATKVITADEFFELSHDGPAELVRGEVIEMLNPGVLHGKVSARMAFVLMQQVLPRKLGEVLTNDAGFRLERDPDTVRGPAVAFIRHERLPGGKLPTGYFDGPPDLAIEVISPHDKMTDVTAKVDLFLDAGCKMVVLLDPERRTATIYRSQVDPHIVRGRDRLDFSSVVDGFQLPLDELFE